MDMQTTSQESVWTAVFYYLTILVSASLIVFPNLRMLSASKIAVAAMTLGMAVVFVRRESKRRTLGLTLGQIYAQARQGRKFAPSAVELAATVVWCWAVTVTL